MNSLYDLTHKSLLFCKLNIKQELITQASNFLVNTIQKYLQLNILKARSVSYHDFETHGPSINKYKNLPYSIILVQHQ